MTSPDFSSTIFLAVLLAEPGGEPIAAVMPRSLVSVANEAEVISVLVRKGARPERALELVLGLSYQVIDLNAVLARRAGTLWQEVKPRGLSLGDRCCLALAEREKLPAVTADQRWADLDLSVDVRVFRRAKVRR